MNTLLRYILILTAVLTGALAVSAQPACADSLAAADGASATALQGLTTDPAAPRVVERTWLFGAGGGWLYDAYLSPLDYHGPSASVGMQNVRKAHWGAGKVTQLTQFEVDGTYATNPDGNGHYYDGQVTVGFGWHYHFGWSGRSHCDLALGGLAEFSGGGTYSTRNGNNPAQGRASFDVAPSAIFTYAFRAPHCMRGHPRGPYAGSAAGRSCKVRVQLDVPLAGVMFAPQYGQSYYELFSLGHYDHNVCPTYPGNAPSARLQATLHLPVSCSAQLVVGYRGEARQSMVNHLGRHTWQNGAVIGFTRDLNFVTR